MYSRENKMSSYTQIFRSGIVEASCFGLFGFSNEKKLYGKSIEDNFENTVKSYIESLLKFKINFPFFISISLLNTKGYILVFDNNYRISNGDFNKIYEDDLLLPSIFIENENELDSKLKSCFDILWNANGFLKSPGN